MFVRSFVFKKIDIKHSSIKRSSTNALLVPFVIYLITFLFPEAARFQNHPVQQTDNLKRQYDNLSDIGQEIRYAIRFFCNQLNDDTAKRCVVWKHSFVIHVPASIPGQAICVSDKSASFLPTTHRTKRMSSPCNFLLRSNYN